MKTIGILFGDEKTFPQAVLDRINDLRINGIQASAVKIDKVMQSGVGGYSVIIDRISPLVPFYRTYLKAAALGGAAVLNNPFWMSADDKFFQSTLAAALAIPIPRTVVLPSYQPPPDIDERSLLNLSYPLDWKTIAEYIQFPAFLKSYSGGGRRFVHRIETQEDFFIAYQRSGDRVMMLQEEIQYSDYFLCYQIGPASQRVVRYEPHSPRHQRLLVHQARAESKIIQRIKTYSRTLNRWLGYDINMIEFGISNGIPYAIDMCNPVPAADFYLVGPESFEWLVGHLAEYAVERARRHKPGKNNLTWGKFARTYAGNRSM